MKYSILNDHLRFKQILKGKIKESLKNQIKEGKRFINKGGKNFSVPIYNLDVPRFIFGDNNGQKNKQQKGAGQGEVGNQEGNKELEAEFSEQELAEILSEELELPNIKESSKKNIERQKYKYNSMGPIGPNSLKNFKKTFKETLKRQIIEDENFDFDQPLFIDKKDFRYRQFNIETTYENSAVIFYIMDISGSMGDREKEIVRNASFWLNLWIKNQYKNIETKFIIHDSTAKEVDENTFFMTKESGGTLISSALNLLSDILYKKYVPEQWNIYVFQFTDGDNWGEDDSNKCIDLLKDKILNVSNLYGYCQVHSRLGSGHFYSYIDRLKNENLILTKINNNQDILKCLKDLLGKGK